MVFNASGGWDTTYLMDPKGVNGINRLYKDGDILTKGAHKYAPIKKHAQGGMCNEDFYAEFGGEHRDRGGRMRLELVELGRRLLRRRERRRRKRSELEPELERR